MCMIYQPTKRNINHSDDFLSKAATTFSISNDSVWDTVEKLKILTRAKALAILQEHFSNISSFVYKDGALTKKRVSSIFKKFTMEDSASVDQRKHFIHFMKDAIHELHTKDFRELIRSAELFPPDTVIDKAYLLVMPFPVEEIYPPVAHQIEKASVIAGISNLSSLHKGEVKFDLSALQPVLLDIEVEKVNACRLAKRVFKIDLLDEDDLRTLTADAITSVYSHLYESHHQPKEEAEMSEQIFSSLRSISDRIDDIEALVQPKKVAEEVRENTEQFVATHKKNPYVNIKDFVEKYSDPKYGLRSNPYEEVLDKYKVDKPETPSEPGQDTSNGETEETLN